MHQRVVALAGFHDDVAALAAVAAGRSSTRNKLLPAEGEAAIATIARFHPDFCLIDKHWRIRGALSNHTSTGTPPGSGSPHWMRFL